MTVYCIWQQCTSSIGGEHPAAISGITCTRRFSHNVYSTGRTSHCIGLLEWVNWPISLGFPSHLCIDAVSRAWWVRINGMITTSCSSWKLRQGELYGQNRGFWAPMTFQSQSERRKKGHPVHMHNTLDLSRIQCCPSIFKAVFSNFNCKLPR